jgi:transposase
MIWLEEKLTAAGITAIFYPKFHGEVNYIELIWSRLKHSLRKECRLSFPDLQWRLPELIELFAVHQAKRALQHCLRLWMATETV